MELRNLRHLVALAHRLNYSRAAEDLGLSQPALTRSIQALEQQIKIRLFDRDRSGVVLTFQGESVLQQARILLAEFEEFEQRLEQTADGTDIKIRFGMAPFPACALLPEILSKQVEISPNFSCDVVVRNPAALWPMLIAGEIEFFVSVAGQVPETPPVRTELLGTAPNSWLVRSGHPLLNGECPGARFPVVLSSRGLIGRLPSDLIERLKGSPQVIEDFGTLAALTRATDAIWLSSTYAVPEELKEGTLREFSRGANAEVIVMDLVMYSLNRRTRSPGALLMKQEFSLKLKQLSSVIFDNIATSN